MASDFCVRVGFRFHPTDEELVDYFLRNKVTAAPPDIVREFDLFGDAEPWEIWELFEGPKLKDQDLYFFTNLKKNKKKKKGSRRVDRKVGLARLGTWSEGEPSKLVYKEDTEEPIGRKRKLRYENKGSDHHGRWFLDEYSLLDDSDCVICRLRINDKSFSSSSGNKKRKNTSSSCQEPRDHDQKGKKVRKVEEVEGAETSSVVVNIVPNNNNHNNFDDGDDEELKGIVGNCDSGDTLLNIDIEQELRAMLDCDEEVNNMDCYLNGTTTTPPALPDHHQYPHEIAQLVQPLQTDSGLAVDELVMMNMTNNNNIFDDEGGQYLMGYNVNHDGLAVDELVMMNMTNSNTIFDDEGGQYLMGYNVNHDGLFDIEQELMAMLPHDDDDHYLAETQLRQLPLMPTLDHSGNLGADADGGVAATLQMEAAANIFDGIGNQQLLDTSYWSMSFFNDMPYTGGAT